MRGHRLPQSLDIIKEEIMPMHRHILSAAALSALIALPAAAQTVTSRNISYDVAKQIAEAAMENCTARGAAVAVHVVDATGQTVVALRADGARPHVFQNSFEKAYTAMAFERPSSEMERDLEAGDMGRTQQADFPNMVLLAGGLPIRVDDEVVGGVGISGTQGPVTEECAQAGIDSVSDQL